MYKINTAPVLFLVFNRIGSAKRVFSEIKRAKPKRLFIASDGARENREGEKEVVKQIRDYILENINWKCEVKTLFREKNLGCKNAVADGISWFFDNVEEGIILEDDCLPSQSFFRFCQEMLEKYRDDERVMQISGTNVNGASMDLEKDYFFATNFNVWGWATWRRAWKLYDKKMSLWPKFKKEGWTKYFEPSYLNRLKFVRTYDAVYDGKIDTWDYQWWLSCAVNNGLCVIPRLNLITNIGLTGLGTHMEADSTKILANHEMKFPLKHNPIMINRKKYQIECNRFFRRGLIKRKLTKIFRL
jgi:hypothetical protein